MMHVTDYQQKLYSGLPLGVGKVLLRVFGRSSGGGKAGVIMNLLGGNQA